MKIRVQLRNANHDLVVAGKIDTDVVADTHLVKYKDKIYGFHPTSQVMTAMFVECGEALDITDFLETDSE